MNLLKSLLSSGGDTWCGVNETAGEKVSLNVTIVDFHWTRLLQRILLCFLFDELMKTSEIFWWYLPERNVWTSSYSESRLHLFFVIIQIGSRERVSNAGCRSQLFARGVTDRSMWGRHLLTLRPVQHSPVERVNILTSVSWRQSTVSNLEYLSYVLA